MKEKKGMEITIRIAQKQNLVVHVSLPLMFSSQQLSRASFGSVPEANDHFITLGEAHAIVCCSETTAKQSIVNTDLLEQATS